MKHFYEKIILSSFFVLGINLVVQAQTKTENYILTRELLEATTDTTKANTSKKQHINKITYFDGLGREKLSIISPKSGLSISTMAIPDQMLNPSLATKVTYDGFGRVNREYLPGVVGDLNYTDAITYTDYPESQVYSQKQYENSPLNRVLKQGAPGAAWDVNTNNAIKFDYQTNKSSDEVIFFDAKTTFNSSSNIYEIRLERRSNPIYYEDGTLYKTITIDENNQPIIEFKNKEGQVLLKRIDINTGRHDTYYVYDIYGNLTYVIPPKLLNLYYASLPVDWLDLMNDLGYQYKYDNKNRLVEKKLPGKGWEYMVYDKQNRLVGVQDENMRNENYWIFTKYDKFGRVAITGKTWEAEGRTRNDVQTTINDHLGNNNVSRDPNGYNQDNIKIYYNEAGFGYNNHVLTVNYYDDYPMTQEGVSLTGNVFTQTIATGDQLKGLPTLTVTRSLGTWENNQWNFEYNYTFYDNNYLRAIKNHKINYLGGSTIVESELDFRGKAKQVITTHKRLKTDTPLKVTEVFSYDKFERLTKHTHQINSGKVEVLTQNSYNNIGQLTSKNVGNTIVSPYQTVDYTYNIRGWLTQINDITNLGTDLFAFKINYNTKDQTKASHNTQELFNGNISQTFWTSQENTHIRSYDYNYDGLNRLTNASYSNLAKDFAGAYDEQLSYDHNGNIKTLKRYGQTEQATPRLIDNLFYDYENGDRSNKLQKVTDSSLAFGFNDGNKTGNDYAYDKNGNLKLDLNKGITDSITYNHLNLPILVKKGVGSIEYAYDASGAKLRKIVKAQPAGTVEGTIATTITEYLDGFQYKDGVLQFFPTTEGYVNAITDGTISYNYVYNLTDHLGNVRVSYAWDEVNNTLKTVNEDHYYPFGLQHKGYTRSATREIVRESDLIEIGIGLAAPGGSTSGSANYKYKYNGKELQDEFNLNLYDYGARNYDPTIGRWFNVDPLAEKYWMDSPYAYAVNNPVYFVDLDGMQIGGPGDGEGTEEDPIQLQEAVVKAKKQERRDPIFGYNYDSDTLNENSRKLNTAVSNYKPAQQIDAVINETTFFVLTWPVGGYAFKGASFILKPVITKAGTIIWKKIATTAVLEAAEGAVGKAVIETTEQVAVKTGAYVTENLAGFYVRGSTTIANGTYTRTIQSLANTGNKSLFDLIKVFEAEARAGGVNNVVINGIDIVETRLINEGGARLLGYTFKQTSANSIQLTKILK
ncbi:MAG TPA: hypothetical protein DCR77_01665 [Flavobacteriaceae bacterium]|nr:hypothetical protein [Flavobacteriaceae bacterium]